MYRADVAYSTPCDVVCTRKELLSLRFDGGRITATRIDGQLWLETWCVIDALDRYSDEVEGCLAIIPDAEARTVVVVEADGSEREQCFIAVSAAWRMARACSDVAVSGSSSGRFLRWLATRIAHARPPRGRHVPTRLPAGRRYGTLVAIDGGRA